MTSNPSEPIKMTDKELYENLQFKLTEKLLRKRFPWVTKLLIPSKVDINKYSSVIFLDVYVDLKKVKDFFNSEYSKYVSYFLSRGDFGHTLVFEDGFHFIDTIISDFGGDDAIKFNQGVNDILSSLKYSSMIPEDELLPKTMVFNQYKIDPSSSV